MSLLLILPRKSIVLLPSISPHAHADLPLQFLMKQFKLSLRTNYSKMELFYFKQQTKTPSPTKLATVTSLAKKTYNESFTKVIFQIHPSVIPFLTKVLVILSFCISSGVLQYRKEKQMVEYFQLEHH